MPESHPSVCEVAHLAGEAEMNAPPGMTMSQTTSRQGINVLQLRPIHALVRWWGFPYVFQAVTLILFLALAVLSWQSFAPSGVSDKLYAKTNLVQLLIWGLWWPAMVWAAVLLGRAWCTVCPLELVANVGERAGRGLGIKQFVLGKWLRAGFLIVALYALIQMLVAGVHLHRVPAYTSIFLWSLLGSALFVGLVFKDRAFCRGFCPVGLLLGTYGRGGMLAIRHESTDQCESCTSKDCVLACNRTRWQGRSCPSLLNPARLDSNRDCLICGQCIKACQPDNMQLLVRRPFHSGDAREKLAAWPVMLFVMLVSGFVSYEVCTEWASAKAAFLWVPQRVSPLLGLAVENGWIKGLWTLFVYPMLLWLVLGTVIRLSGAATSLPQAWRRLALPLVVVIAAGHMAKGLAKFTSWSGYLPGALRDPVGADTVVKLSDGSLPSPGVLLAMSWVSAIGALLIVAAAFLAVREARLANPEKAGRLALPILTLALCFGLIILGWGFAA
jgi:ferredoxin